MSSCHRDYDYLEWIARLASHIPDRGTHLVHYYGGYSNAHRWVTRRREIFLAVPLEDDPLKILHHFGWRFDPLKLPGRSPPLSDHFCPDPFPDYGPQ